MMNSRNRDNAENFYIINAYKLNKVFGSYPPGCLRETNEV